MNQVASRFKSATILKSCHCGIVRALNLVLTILHLSYAIITKLSIVVLQNYSTIKGYVILAFCAKVTNKLQLKVVTLKQGNVVALTLVEGLLLNKKLLRSLAPLEVTQYSNKHAHRNI